MTVFLGVMSLFWLGLWWFTDRLLVKALDLCGRALDGWERAEREIVKRSRTEPGDEWKN